MKKTKISFSTVLTGFFATLLLFFSCEVGLGEAVDTRPPSIVIEKPEVDKVIRQKFLISGTWEDDGTIDNVYVLLKRTDGKPLDGTSLERKIDATFTVDELDDEKGTWQAVVDPLEEDNQIIDGSYQATVVINDKGRHSTTQITTFTIDNTAPVLILSKPNSTPQDQTLSAYGQRLFLEGSIADSTKETWVQLDFYSGEECTQEQYLTTIETGMISPTDVNSNNARLAIYNTDLTQVYATEYYQLYGATEKSGSKQIYAKLTVYDTAETFPVEGEDDNITESGKIKGNPSQSFYLTKKLAESITKSQTANGFGLAPIDIYNVLNGTYVLKNESRAADAITIKEELLSEEQKKDISVFTINPENSPYFTISGLKTLNLDGKDFEEGNTIVNGTQTLEVSVFMGSDSIALKDDENFYVYLLECDKYGKPVKEDVEENRIKLYSKYKETGSGSEKKTYYKIGGKTDHKTSSGAYVFSIPMNKSLRADPDKGIEGFVNINLEFGKNYIIRVSGKDTEDNEIETTDGGYGFSFTAGGVAPRLTITEPADNTVFIKKGDGLHVEGSIISEGGMPRLTITNAETIVDVNITPEDDGSYSFSGDISPEDLAFDQNESVIYSLIFSATCNATESTMTKSVWYDVEGPVVTMSEPTPLVKTNSVKADGTTVAKDSINGVIHFSGSIIDEFDSRFGSATYKVTQNSIPVNKPGLSGPLEKNVDFYIDTTKLTDKLDAEIVISAYDKVGNLTEYRSTYYVDQSTDEPLVKTASDSMDITKGRDESILGDNKNLFVRGSSLVLNVEDDDSVKRALVTLGKKNENGTFEVPASSDETGTLYKEYASPSAISHQLPTAVGIYLATVTAYDKNYKSDTETPNSFTKSEFIIRVTGNGPSVTLSKDKDFISTLGAAGTNKLTFDITDEGNGPYQFYKNGVLVFNNKTSPFDYSLEYPEGTTEADEITFEVMDKNQGFTDIMYKPQFDNTLPEVAISATPTTSLTEESSYLFKGTMSDTPSGIEAVKIKFIDGNNPDSTTATASEWLDCIAGSKSWNYEAVWASNELKDVFEREGNKSFIVKAIDNAGNEKTVSDTFVYDKMKPVVQSIAGADITKASDVALTVNIKDTNPIKPAVVVKQNGTEIQPTVNVTIGDVEGSGTDYTSRVIIPFASVITSDGVYEVEVIAKDANGKSSSPASVKITRDSAKPLVTNVKLTEEELSKDAYYDDGHYYVNNTKSTYKISGIATDNIGVDSVALVVTNKDDTTKTAGGTYNGSVGQWSFTGIDLKAWTASGASAKIIVKDQAGNEADENVNLDLIFDVIAPSADHKIDDSQKNLEFRIGDAPNDAGEEDVGGKYSNGSYGSALTMQLRGNFPDNAGGSGINKFYYKTFNNQEVKIDSSITGSDPVVGTGENEGKIFFKDDAALIAYVVANKTDVFSPIAVETRNVEYNIGPYEPETWVTVPTASVRFGGSATTTANASGQYKSNKKGYVQFRTSVDTNFKTTMKDFVEGKNYLVIVAQDNAGNLGLDTATVAGVEYPCYSLNVDITAPTISSAADEGTYTNLIKKLESGEPNPTLKVEISGTVSDKSRVENGSSGLKNIVFTSNQSNEEITLNLAATDPADIGTPEDPTLINWTVDIRSLLTRNGNAIISAKVTDNAGYETSTPIANVTVDRTAPTVRITSPEAGTYTGSSISLSGTAADGQGAGLDTAKKMILYYTTSSSAGAYAPNVTPSDSADPSTSWKKLAEINAAENWSYTVNAAALSGISADDNTQVYFTLSATDKAGSGNTGYSVPRNVVIDRKAPEVAITVPASESGAVIQAGSYKFEGTISDENEISEGKAELYQVTGEGASETESKININDYALSITPPATAGGNWTWSCQVYDLTAATYKIKVTAKDKAGNESTVVDSPRIFIDNTPPVVHVEQTGLNDSDGNLITTELVSGTTYYAKGDYTLSVEVDDINFDNTDTSLYSVTVNPTQEFTITKNTQNKNKFTVAPTTPADGLFTYTIKDVKDKAGNKANDVTIKVQRDTTGPRVDIRNPATDITDPANSLSGTSYSFRINANDGNGVGVAKLYYAFSKNPSTPESWTEVPVSDGDYNIDQNLETLGEGNWYLYAKAQDKSGNVTSSVDVAKRAFPVDKSAPTLYVNSLKSGVNPLYSEISNDGYTISGTATDSNDLHATEAITIEVDGVSTTIAKSEFTGNAWSYKILTGTENGELKSDEPVVVKVTAKDIAGKTTPMSFTLYYDTKDPELEVTAPVEDEAVDTNAKVIKGTISESGYGIKKLEYKLYRGNENTPFVSGDTDNPNADYPIAIKGEQWYISKNDGKVFLGSTQGALRLEVTATENKPAGVSAVTGTREYATTKTVNFYYDTANPELTETGIGTRGKTTNAEFTLSGTASDSNALASVTIKWKVDSAEKSVVLTPASGNWSQVFKVGTTNSSADNYVADGANDFTIIAKDITGKETQLTRTVVVDTQKPVIEEVSVNATGGVTIGTGTNTVIWYKTTSIPVTVPVTEYGVSGVSKVEYATQSGDSATWTPLSNDGTNYTGTINFAGNGTQTLRLKATDVAGNVSTESTVPVNIDTSAPNLTALYYKKGSEAVKGLDSTVYLKTGTSIIVYGNYKDEQSGVENLTFKIGDTSVSPTVTYSTTAIGSTTESIPTNYVTYDSITDKTSIKSWKAEIPPTSDGQFTVTGKNRVQTAVEDQRIFAVAVDGNAPTVTIINPAEGTTGTNALNGTSYSFRINADDGSGVGVTQLSYAFGKNATAPTTTAWTVVDFTGGDKNIDIPLVTGITPVTDTNGKVTKLSEGNWYVFAKATDKAGNETSTAVSRAFSVDRSNPTLAVSGLNESGVNALYKEISNNKYVLSGSVSDTNALAATGAVSIEIDEQTPVSATVNGTSWTYDLAVGTAAGTLKKDSLVSVKVTATDITGKTSEKEYTLYYDTKDPELEVTAPVDDEAVETGTKVIKGTVSDGGYGIKKLEYSLYSGSTLIASGDTDHQDGAYPIAIKGEQWYISKNDGKIPLGSTEGALRLEVTATEDKPDGAAVVTGTREYVTTKTVNFYYDTADPTLTEATIGATGKTKNEGFTLSGLATDSNALASVEISWGTNNKITLTPTSEQLKSMDWSQDFVVGSATGTNHVDDGTNEFTIIAKDISGKEKQLTRTVVVDTVSPTCGTPEIDGTDAATKTWYNTSFINIKLEDVADTNGTGISKVEYTTGNSNWYSMSGSGTTYTATVNCDKQGENTIQVRVTDAAGNQTTAGSVTVYVDTKEPSLEYSYAKYLSDAYEAVSELLINGDNGYEIKITTKDEGGGTETDKNSGIASVEYSYTGEDNTYTIAGTKTGDDWFITVPKDGKGTNNYSNTGSNKIYVIIKDNAGNEIRERILTVTKDTTPPTVDIKSFTRAGTQTNLGTSESPDLVDDVNGTITISGLADDTNRFGSVKLEYQKDGESSWTPIPTTSSTSWTTTLNTKATGFSDKAKYTIKATATDAAGNTAEDTQVVYVNQDSDRPVITVTNMTLSNTETSYLKRTSRLEGTVSDDDGNVTKLEYSTNGTTWTEAALEYGTAWSISDLPEGENKLYFRVTDSVNTSPFATTVEVANATTEAANQPKIKDNSGTYVTHTQGSLALKFKVVTKQPEVDEKKYQVYNSSTSTWEERDNLGTLGGVYTKFKISLKAKSDAFIANVKAKYTTDSYDINFVTTETTTNNSYHTWSTDEIALDATKTEIKLKISDASSTTDPMTLEQTVTYAVDNTAPTISIKEPSSTAGVKETMQFDMSEAATAYYVVTKNDVTTAPTAASAWTEILDTTNGLTRYVFFDDGTETDHTERFALYLTETSTNPKHLGITTKADIEKTTNPYETITPVKFWVKAVDNCGNISYASKVVNVDPQGNRPTVTLNSPKNTENGLPPTLGGTIRMDGNVADDEGAKFVWIQLVRSWTETNNGTTSNVSKPFNADTLKYLVEKRYTIGNMNDNTDVTAATINALADDADVSNYGIKVPVTGNSWNLSINGNQEFNQAAEVNIDFTIYATDLDTNADKPHRSAPITQSIKIDSRTPYINTSDLVLVKYNGDTEVARKAYKDGEDVDGIWYLQGMIRDDDSGIKTVSYKKNGAAEYTPAITEAGGNLASVENDTHFYFTAVRHSEDSTSEDYNKYDYSFSVPLGSDAANQVGTDLIQIYAVENTTQNLNTDPSFKVTYDNKAPVFTTSGSAFVKLSQEVYNSSGFYTFGAIASEDKVNDVAQSGVERIAFYFTRDLTYGLNELDSAVYTEHNGTTTKDLFDVMIYHSNVDADDVASGNMIVGYDSLTYSEGLYWRTHAGTSSGKSFTYTGDADPNIHAGGLVKINGVIYTIKTVSGQTITVDKDITGTSADFALCNVIDNGGEKNGSSTSSTHGYGFGYYPSRVTDDGDLITETFNSQGTDWIFDASINSRNLPDGPITLHMVAFDKAGNVTTPYTMNGTVKNNAPRIAGLILGTDENGNGTVDSDEFVNTYSGKFTKGYDTAGNEMHDVTFPVVPDGGEQTSLLTVKGLTVVKPEIIGGNGAISYSYKVKTAGTWGTEVLGGALAKNGGGNVSGTTDDVVTGVITLPVSAFIGTTNDADDEVIPDGELSEFKFTFGDSTPGTSKTDATGKNSASMSVFLDVALRETNKAKNWILPFYWKSKTDNSLFNQSAEEGHIELATDWVTTTSYTGTTGEYDADPKVSGKIKIEGIAQDDTLLNEIKVQFGTSMGGLGTDNTAIATYNAAGGSWTVTALENDGSINSTTGWASAVQQATYQDLIDVGIIEKEEDLPANVELTTKVPYTSQDYGHVVHWILYLDTALVDGVAATDVTVTATATDRGTPKWNSTTNAPAYTANAAATTGGTAISAAVTKNGNDVSVAARTGNYQVDVVPYISNVATSISSFLSSDYARSAIGDYPIKVTIGSNSVAGETIKVSGFNLNPTNKAVDSDTAKSDVRISSNKLALSGTTKKGIGLKVEAGTGDDAGKWLVTMSASGNGNLVFFTNGLPTLNNVDSEAEYNKESSLIHASLNNDRKFSLWNFTSLRTNNSAPKSNGAIYPSMAMNNDTPQFAYVNNVEGYGLAEFWNGTTETKIYENWDLFTYTSLALNSEGKRAALYDINVVQEGSGYPSDSGGIMTNFFNNPPNTTWNGTTYYFRNNNVWMDGLYKEGVTAVLGRYQYPTIRMLGNNNISHVFYSVYDSLDDRVVFRYFTVGTSNSLISNATAITSENSKVYINKNQLNQVAVGGSWPNYTSTNNNNRRFSSNGSYAGTTTNPQAFATGQTVGLYTATAGVPTTKDANGNVTAARGILVYYAGTNMYYTYATNDANTTWSDPVVLDSNCESSYISMVVDSADHVHIAYQNNIAGDVKYIYIPTYSTPATRKTVTVDSYLTVGDKLTLDVIDSTPYIGYKGLGNTAKVAWYKANDGVPAVTTLTDGIDSNEKFTGDWNIEIIPNRIVDSDTNRFNVGVGRTSKRPVIGYSNNQSGSKGIEYLTRTADLSN